MSTDQPIDPSPTQPMEHEPTTPSRPAEPTEPTHQTEPTRQTEPTHPTHPTEPAAPAAIERPRGPHLPAILLGIVCLAIAVLAVGQELGGFTVDWGSLGPFGIVLVGGVLVAIGLTGLLGNRRARGR